MWRKVLYYLVYLLVSVVGLALILLVLLVIFERKWGEVVVKQSLDLLNEQLDVPVSTSGVDFTFFANFPHASLHLHDVVIPSTHSKIFGKSDTLLVAKSVFLALNPFDLLQGQSRVEAFRIVQGYLNIKVAKTGERNYDILKRETSHQDSTEKKPLFLEIQAIRLDQMVLQFADARNLLTARLIVPNLQAQLAIQHDNFKIKLRAEGLVETIRQGDFIFAQKEHFALRTRFDASPTKIETAETLLYLDRNKLHIAGIWDLQGTETQLNIAGTHLDLRTILGFASQYKWQLPQNIELKGALNASLNLKGAIQPTGNPRLSMAVHGEDLTLKINDLSYQIKTFEGSFSNGSNATRQSTLFEISKCEITRGTSIVHLLLKLSNLEHPTLYTLLKGSLQNDEIPLPFLAPYVQSYNHLRGEGEFVTTLTRLDSLSFANLENPKFKFNIDFDLNKIAPNPFHQFTELRGAITLSDENLIKGAIRGKWNEVDFELGVNVLHFLSLFRETAPRPLWTLNARLTNWRIPNDGIPVWNPETRNSSSNDSSTIRSADLWKRLGYMKGELSIFRSQYRGDAIDSFQAQFALSQEKFQVNLKNLLCFGGHLHGDLCLENDTPQSRLLRANLYPDRLNLQSVFRGYENFGLKNFGHENLSGLLSGTLSLHLPFIGNSLDFDRLQMRTKIQIYNGELRDINGLEKLSTFIRLEELKRLHFSTIENEISVARQKITIPRMRIKSSALSLNVQGEQYFNSHFQYRLQLSLSDLLFNRWRTKSKNWEDESYEESGANSGGSLYVIIEGDSTDVRVSFDRKALAERLRTHVQQEKEELRELFNDEFRWRKNDSAMRTVKPNTPNPHYTIEWEENDSINRVDSAKRNKKKISPFKKQKDLPTVTWEDD
ncbi:MAG: hypothetical protein ACTTKZ_01315 [Bacteroides sp.]